MDEQILGLKNKIIEVLGDELGDYTLSGGVSAKAIAVDTGNNYPPQGTQVEGLEVVIVPSTDVNMGAMLQGYEWIVTSQILIKQWGAGHTLSALEKIVPLLGNQVEIGARVMPDNSLGNIESVRITFKWNYLNRTWGN